MTVDRWTPPALSGPASQANFCLALTSIYRHMAELSRAADPHVATQIVSDYVGYEPTVVAAAPTDVRQAAATYLGAVASYLAGLARAGLNLAHLPPSALAGLRSPSTQPAASEVLGYSRSQCGYVIGGS